MTDTLQPDRTTAEVMNLSRIGSYHVVDVLGEGNLGLVFLGRDDLLERDVAIKLIRPGRLTRESLSRFESEAKAMARVQHENVVAIYALGDVDGAPYIAMEYIPGETVHTLTLHNQLSLDRALSVLDQACRGVYAIHQSGTIHGDLKPSNLLVGPAFRIAVGDLGFAHRVNDDPSEELIVGTPEYMAPELVLGDDSVPALRTRADVYALGVIAYRLLTGTLPFTDPSPHATMFKHVNDQVEPPSERKPGLSRAFDEPILAALEKDPAKRTPSAQAFGQALAIARERADEAAAGHRFIVVDDDPDFLSLIAACLEDDFPEATLVLCESGKEAREEITTPFDLAVLDLHLPDDDAGDLTQLMRHQAPVLVITGRGTAADWQRLQALGAKGFLVKPLDPYALAATVRRLTARSSLPSI